MTLSSEFTWCQFEFAWFLSDQFLHWTTVPARWWPLKWEESWESLEERPFFPVPNQDSLNSPFHSFPHLARIQNFFPPIGDFLGFWWLLLAVVVRVWTKYYIGEILWFFSDYGRGVTMCGWKRENQDSKVSKTWGLLQRQITSKLFLDDFKITGNLLHFKRAFNVVKQESIHLIFWLG